MALVFGNVFKMVGVKWHGLKTVKDTRKVRTGRADTWLWFLVIFKMVRVK
jgi:hypothetical protein